MHEERPSSPIILLFGPTGVGKTELLRTLGNRSDRRGSVEVVSADSVQVYRGLNIGSAKPSLEQRSRIPHHLIDIRNPDEQFTVGDFLRLADEAVAQIRTRGNRAVVSGGTAFYLHAYLFGLAQAPACDPEIRARVRAQLDADGLPALCERLRAVDPQTADRLGPADAYRITRALEVFEQTGRPLSDFPRPQEPRAGIQTVNVGLARPRAKLYERINARVDQMIAGGLYEEVRGLSQAGYGATSPGLRAIGYAEWFTPDGRLVSEAAASEVAQRIKRNSRRYAKRQLTFFARLPEVIWVDADDPGDLPLG